MDDQQAREAAAKAVMDELARVRNFDAVGRLANAVIDAYLAALPVAPEQPTQANGLSAKLAALSQWIDDGNAHRDQESREWGRLAKIAEEGGEVIAAYIGATGQNPRKGVTHTQDDVLAELLDVAVTAPGAHESLRGNPGDVMVLLDGKLDVILDRAGLAALVSSPSVETVTPDRETRRGRPSHSTVCYWPSGYCPCHDGVSS